MQISWIFLWSRQRIPRKDAEGFCKIMYFQLVPAEVTGKDGARVPVRDWRLHAHV